MSPKANRKLSALLDELHENDLVLTSIYTGDIKPGDHIVFEDKLKKVTHTSVQPGSGSNPSVFLLAFEGDTNIFSFKEEFQEIAIKERNN